VTLRLRRGGTGTGAPAVIVYGPQNGPQSVRDGASPGDVTVFPGTPNVNFTQLNPANSQATNQSAITNDTTGKVWWPKGTYNVSGQYTLKQNTEYRLESVAGYTRSASDTAVLNGPGNAAGNTDAVTLTNATWKGGKIQNFTSGMVLYGGCVVEDVEVTNIYNVGVGSLGSNNRVTRGWIHHNGKYGITANPQVVPVQETNVIFEYLRINDNNTRVLATDIDAGSSKFLFIDGHVLRFCWFDHNYGNGPWWDTNCQNVTCEENVIENHYAGTAAELHSGLFYEACFGGTVIQHNLLLNNGSTNGSLGNGNVQISSARGANGGANAVILLTRNKVDCGDGAIAQLGMHNGHVGELTHGVHVEDNEVWLRGTATSKFGGSTAGELSGQDNLFSNNKYKVASLSTAYWHWNTVQFTPRTWADWQGFGFDTDASGATRTLI
jgi:hypothetical protein